MTKTQNTKEYGSSNRLSFWNFNFGNSSEMKRGFTLIEIIVALALFMTVALISAGALLSVADANRKAQVLKSVMNNLNFALESMSREIRVGSNFYCNVVLEGTTPSGITNPRNCDEGGGNFLAFLSSSGSQIIYRLNGNLIEKSIDGGISYVGLTAPEVSIDSATGLRFYVTGALAGDNFQPRIVITLSGEAGNKDKIVTNFDIQTTISQRFRDN